VKIEIKENKVIRCVCIVFFLCFSTAALLIEPSSFDAKRKIGNGIAKIFNL
jgi:hypothetical protein